MRPDEGAMAVWRWEDGVMAPESLLWDALRIPKQKFLVISLVGGGGKTSVMYRLADELVTMGKRVIITTSTHIFRPAGRIVVEARSAGTVQDWIEERGKGLAGRKEESGVGQAVAPAFAGWAVVTGNSDGSGKLTGLPEGELEKLAFLADVLLIEADGAKRLPLKLPRDSEPVISPRTDVVIGCAGLDCVGKPFEEACFRPELAMGWLDDGSGDLLKRRITPEHVAKILTSEFGTLKGVGSRQYRIVLNKADDRPAQENACQIARRMARQEENRPHTRRLTWCVITSFRAPQ